MLLFQVRTRKYFTTIQCKANKTNPSVDTFSARKITKQITKHNWLSIQVIMIWTLSHLLFTGKSVVYCTAPTLSTGEHGDGLLSWLVISFCVDRMILKWNYCNKSWHKINKQNGVIIQSIFIFQSGIYLTI